MKKTVFAYNKENFREAGNVTSRTKASRVCILTGTKVTWSEMTVYSPWSVQNPIKRVFYHGADEISTNKTSYISIVTKSLKKELKFIVSRNISSPNLVKRLADLKKDLSIYLKSSNQTKFKTGIPLLERMESFFLNQDV